MANNGTETTSTSNPAQSDANGMIYFLGEDTADTSKFTGTLIMFDFQVEVFHLAADLAAAIEKCPPHAVIFDRDAKECRIAEQTIAHKAGSTQPSFPILYISSEDDFTQRLQAVRAGAEGYYIKPIDMVALTGRLNEKMNRQEIRAYRILAIDDDVTLSEFYQAVLNSAGMHVKLLNDPSTILETLKIFQPELILIAMYMPVCTGVELAKLIRQNNLYLEIPIVFLSSEDNLERQLDAIQIGADNFLTKPIDPENLISAISSRAERYRALRRIRFA